MRSVLEIRDFHHTFALTKRPVVDSLELSMRTEKVLLFVSRVPSRYARVNWPSAVLVECCVV